MERQGYKNSVAYKQLEASSRSLVAQTNQLDRTVKKIDVTVGQHQRNVGNYSDAIGMVAPQLSQFAGRLGLVAAGVTAVGQSFTSNLRMEPINQALLVASGTTEQFNTNITFLRESTDRLGLEFISTAESFKLWQGAAKFSNLTADESRKIFESVANAAAKMKMSNDQVQGTFLALSQMMSKGKVQAEELRGQLGERLPGAFALAAKAMGVTEQELNKMLETGQVVASDFLPKFAAQLDISFGNDKTERIEGMQASVNRLKNEFDALWQSEKATSFFSSVIDGLSHLTGEIRRLVNSDSWSEFWRRLGEVGKSGGGALMTEEDFRKSYQSTKSFNDSRYSTGDSYYKNLSREEFEKELKLAKDHSEQMEKTSIGLQAAILNNRVKTTKAIEFEYKRQEAFADRHYIRMQKIAREKGFVQEGTKVVSPVPVATPKSSGSGNKSSKRVDDIKKYQDQFAQLTKAASDISRKYSSEVVSKEQQEINQVIESYDELIAKYEEYNATTKTRDKLDVSALRQQQGQAVNSIIEKQEKEAEAKRIEEADKKYKELLKQYQTYQQKREKVVKEANKAITELEAKGEKERAEYAKQVRDEELKQLQIDEVENNPAFKKAIEDINVSSQVMLGNAFRTGKETVFKLIDGMADATKEQRGELKKLFGKFFDDGAKEADLGNMQAISGMADGFAELIGQSLQFGDNLEKGVGSIDTMLRTVGQLASALGKMTGSAKMEGIGQGFGYFAAAMQVGNMISQLANQRRDAENRAVQEKIELQNDRQLRATEAITKALQMQLEIINEIYGAERLEKYATSLDTIKKNWKDINDQLSGRYMLTANDDFTNSILSRLNNGETQKQIQKSFSVASAEYYKVAKIFDDLWKFDKLEKLPDDITQAREELARLQNQANLGNVDDYTQKLIDQLQTQIDLFDETMNKLREERTGNTFSSLLSEVSALFLNEGENAGQAWADGFDKTLENYMMQKFSRDFLQEKMQGWYDMMDQFAQSGDGIDQSERDQLSSEWEKIREQGQKRLDDMKNILGLAGTDSTSSLKADSGIRGITEQTANRLESEFGGMRLAQLELLQLTKTNGANYLQIANSHLTELIAIQHNTYRTANNTDRLANIETAIVSLNNKVSSSDAARRGAGL